MISRFDVETSQRFLFQFCVQSLSQSLLYSKLTHHWQLEMALTTTAEIVTIVGGSLGATSVVGSTIHKALQFIRPYSKLRKWTIRVEHIAAVVASAAAEGDLITTDELEDFIKVLGL